MLDGTDLKGNNSVISSTLISRPYQGQMRKIWEEYAMNEMRAVVKETLIEASNGRATGT